MLLMQDIREHGLVEPGVIFEGKVLDGWHRYQACAKAKVEFLATEYTGSDPVAFVISKNAQRRNLTASQRAAAIVMCRQWRKTGDRVRGEAASPLGHSNAELAAEAHTTPRTVQQVKRAVEAGLGEAVRDGMMSAETAAAIAAGKGPKVKNTPPAAPDRKPETPEPSQLKTGQGDEPNDMPSDVEIMQDLEKTLRERDALITALEAEDGAAELAKQVKLTQHYQREIGMEQDKNARLMKERDELRKWHNRVLDAVGEDTSTKALAAIRRAFAKETA